MFPLTLNKVSLRRSDRPQQHGVQLEDEGAELQVRAPRSRHGRRGASSRALLQPAQGAELRTAAHAGTFHSCASLRLRGAGGKGGIDLFFYLPNVRAVQCEGFACMQLLPVTRGSWAHITHPHGERYRIPRAAGHRLLFPPHLWGSALGCTYPARTRGGTGRPLVPGSAPVVTTQLLEQSSYWWQRVHLQYSIRGDPLVQLYTNFPEVRNRGSNSAVSRAENGFEIGSLPSNILLIKLRTFSDFQSGGQWNVMTCIKRNYF